MKEKKRKTGLLICNVCLLLVMIASALAYSGYVSSSQETSKKVDFIRTIESMKRVSQNYLDGEQGYVKDWAAYISEHHMTREAALDFLRSINTNGERYVHIVDMDTFEAWSSYYPKGEEAIETYQSYIEQEADTEFPFREMMEQIFHETEEQFQVLGKYRLQETQAMAVGVGTRVTLEEEDGEKDYLMLRVIPVDVLKKSWIFPTEYSSAEIGIITRSGDYVVQSASMRSENFIEYIRGYNFQDNYNESDHLRQILKENDQGTLEYKNFKGTDCTWYYSSFGENSALDILGVLDSKELKPSIEAWYMILIVCGILLILMLIDGAYLLRMNRRLRESARLSQQANKAKTQFLSAMSHDIRTPLNAVLGMMTLAQNRSHDPEYVENCMEKGIQSGNHLLTLINDVLDISKIESGTFALNLEQIFLPEMMQDLTEMQAQNLAEKKITLHTDFTALPYSYVQADKIRLNQIYVNLLTNAVKYTKAGGDIFLRLYEEDLTDKPDHTCLVFYIEDNGMGMTEEFQKTMYRNFSREINTQVNSIQGTGLGLSIVKQMVDLMDGTITCESEPGRGTIFTVTLDLPVAEGVRETTVESTGQQQIGSMHLLVAEDNDLNWEVLSELLAEQNVICDRAVNGKECVEMLKKAPFGTYAAILMDVHMPVMNGYEATREIRSLTESAWNSIPILAMTADAFAEDVQACKDSGMNGHIAKPVNMNILFSWLRKIKNGQV